MRELFVFLDSFIQSRTKREQIILFLLPIIVFVGIIFTMIMPQIDRIYNEQNAALNEQKELFTLLSNTADEIKLDSLHTQLQAKQNNIQKLQEKSISNTSLIATLNPFAKSIHTADSRFSLSVFGDVEILEDVLEAIEKHHFVFIENLAINAPFSSDLEIKLEGLNFGNKLLKW